MDSSPAEIVKQWLLDAGLADESGGWETFISFLPEEGPDQAICVYDTAGVMDGRLMEDGRQIVHPGVQVRLRGLSYRHTHQRAREIAEAMDAVSRIEVALSSEETYTVQNMSRTGDILPAGIEETGGKRRHHFTLNMVLTVEAN